MDWLDLLAVQGTLKSLLNTTVQKHHFPFLYGGHASPLRKGIKERQGQRVLEGNECILRVSCVPDPDTDVFKYIN